MQILPATCDADGADGDPVSAPCMIISVLWLSEVSVVSVSGSYSYLDLSSSTNV